MPSQSTPLIVTGMHRSGLSLTASLLESSGVKFNQGTQLDSEQEKDIEKSNFSTLQAEILRSQNLDSMGWTLTENIDVNERFREQAQRLIQKYSNYQVWGWKEPNTTLFLEFWAQLLPNAYFLLIYRSPWEVIDSLYRSSSGKLFKNQPDLAIQYWIFYYQKIIHFYNQYSNRCLLANLQTLVQYPQTFVEQLNQKLNLDLSPPSSKIYDSSLLKSDLPLNSYRLSLIDDYFPEATEIYQEMEGRSWHPKQNPDLSWQSLINNKPNPSLIFQDWLTLRQQEIENQILKNETEQYQSQIEQVQAELKESKIQVERTKSLLEASQEEVKKTESILAQSQSQLQQAENELGVYKQKLQQTEWDAKKYQFQLHQTQEELEQSELERHQLKREFQQLENKFYQTEVAFTQSQAQLYQTQKKWERTLAQLHQVQPQLEQAQFALNQFYETEKILQQSQIQLYQTQKKWERTQAQLHQVQPQLEQAARQLTHLHQTEELLQQSQNQLEQAERQLTHLHQTEELLQQSQNQLHQTEALLQQSQSQLHQTEALLQQSQSQLHQTEALLQQYQSQVHQTEEEFEQVQTQLRQTQLELSRLRLYESVTEPRIEQAPEMQYKLLVWEAWCAYQNGDLKRMAQLLKQSLEYTALPKATVVINWLEIFIQNAHQQGISLDTYALTNSPEWKQLLRRTVVLASVKLSV